MQVLIILINVLLAFNSNLKDYSAAQQNLETGWYHSNSERTGELRNFDYLNESLYINPTPIVTVSNFDRLEISEASWAKGEYILTIWLDKKGTELWSDATELAKNNQTNLVFILDNDVICAPMIMATMTNGATGITRRDLSKSDLEEIKKRLKKVE